MKTRLLFSSIILVLCFTFTSKESKAQAFHEGKHYVQASYGFGNFIQTIFSSIENDYDDYSSKIMGPMFGRYEYAVSDKIGIGVNFAYASANISYKDYSYITATGQIFEEEIDWNTFSILGRFNLHFGDHDLIDPYWGVGMGFRNANWKYSNNDPTYNGNNDFDFGIKIPFGFETTFGCRFMFAESFGIYTEVGIAKAIVQFGLVGSF